MPVDGYSAPKKIAYIVSRFPRISETFILYEILELERLGLQIDVFPLLRQKDTVMHAEAAALVQRAHYNKILSWAVLAAQIYWLRTNPRSYIRAWWRAILGNMGSRKFLVRSLAVVPQAALFARQMQAIGVEHVHAHWATHPALAAYVVRQLTGLPYSFTAHAHDIYVERPMLHEKIRQSSFVVTISDYNRQLLSRLYGSTAADKITVIHCGVDLSVFTPHENIKDGTNFTMVCVATLEEKKGHRYLLDACAQLKDQGIAFRCLLIGDGEERANLETQIEKSGLEKHVELLGRQPRDQVRAYIADADVVVLPSIVMSNGKQEGISVALMEALASERPVVATAISGTAELVVDGQTGLLVPERNATALAVALKKLAHDPGLRHALAQAGRAKVVAEFDLRKNAEALHALLMQNWSAPVHSQDTSTKFVQPVPSKGL